ncbi:MAG: sensor domain-containing diguanylate cyclase [Eubacteriales bacterium]|nr:sensor domain-containing diguanylate cyclase [Eubacteriales bacterium]
MIKLEELHKKRRKLIVLSLSIVLFAILVVYSFLDFKKDFIQREITKTKAEIKNTAEIKMETIHHNYADMLNDLDTIARRMTMFDETDRDLIIDELYDMSSVSHFSHIGISDRNGNILDSGGRNGNISEREYFKLAIKGEKNISDVMESKIISQKDIQVMAVPIIKENEIIGICYGVLNIGEIDVVLENETGSMIYTQLVDSDGNYITANNSEPALANGENIWKELERYNFISGSIDKLKEDVENKKSGEFSFEYEGKHRISYYTPLDINNYYLFSASSDELIDLRTEELTRGTSGLLIKVIIAGSILFIGIFYYIQQINKELKYSYKKAITNNEILNISALESNRYIFDYNPKTKVLEKKAGKHNLLFYKDEFTDMPDSILSMDIIDKESVNDFVNIFEEISSKDSIEKEIKISHKDISQWLRIRMKKIYNDHKIINIIGIVDDVTEKKNQEIIIESKDREAKVLKHQAERDALTSLYNAGTFKQKVADILNRENRDNSVDVLLLLDLDNFKLINDTFGHQYGDKVLIDVAEILKHSFRKDDVVARLGGDEFVVLLVGTDGYEKLEPLLENLCKKLTMTYTKGDISITVSASIGIAISPTDGNTFKDLYYKSDIALYQVKNNNKNGYKKFEE